MDLSKAASKQGVNNKKKRSREKNSEDKQAPKKRKLDTPNYANKFSNFEIDPAISNSDIITNAKIKSPQRKKYRNALLYRIYAGHISILDISYDDLTDIVSKINIDDENISDLNILAWSFLSSYRYLAGMIGNVKKEVRESRKKLSELLEKKLLNSPNDPFYSLCFGLQKINPNKSEERFSHISIAAQGGNGFAAYIISETIKKKIHVKNSLELECELEKFLRQAANLGYLYAHVILGKNYLNEGNYDSAKFYFKRGAKRGQHDCLVWYKNPLYKFSELDRQAKEDPSVQLKKAQVLLNYSRDEKVYSEAVKLLKSSIAAGSNDAAYVLAQAIYNNHASSKDEKLLADKLYEEAAQAGQKDASLLIAQKAFYSLNFGLSLSIFKSWQGILDFNGVHPDFEKLMGYYEKSNNQDLSACKDLGIYLFYNQNVFSQPVLDYAEALLIKSLEGGFPESALQLGLVCRNRDLNKAKQLLSQASTSLPMAYRYLGFIALQEGNIEDAIKIFHQAGDFAQDIYQDPVFKKLEGYTRLPAVARSLAFNFILINEAMKKSSLGNFEQSLVFKSIGANPTKALAVFEKNLASCSPSPEGDQSPCSLFELKKTLAGLCYIYSIPGFHDAQKMKQALEKASELGDAHSCNILGRSYAGTLSTNIKITEANPELASFYLHKAANLNHMPALEALGGLYLDGSEAYHVIPNKLEALKYSTLCYKQLSLADQQAANNKNMYHRALSNFFLYYPKNINAHALIADQQCDILDTFVSGDMPVFAQLDNLRNAFLFYTAMFNDHDLKECINSSQCNYGADTCSEIAKSALDFGFLLKLFNKSIVEPGFLVSTLALSPDAKDATSELHKNLDYFPIKKTPFLFKEWLSPFFSSALNLPKLLGELEKRNACALKLLEKFGNSDEATIDIVLDAYSVAPDAQNFDYAKSILQTVFANNDQDWSRADRLAWAKKTLKEMQEYCSGDIVSFINETLRNLIAIEEDTQEYRDRIFIEANPFLFR